MATEKVPRVHAVKGLTCGFGPLTDGRKEVMNDQSNVYVLSKSFAGVYRVDGGDPEELLPDIQSQFTGNLLVTEF